MNKLIRKHLYGGEATRSLYRGRLPSKDKWGVPKIIDELTGEELQPGDYVAATEDGRMITKEGTPQAYLDYLAAHDIPIEGPEFNNFNVIFNKQTGLTTSSFGDDIDERTDRLSSAPTAELLRLDGLLSYEQTLPDNSDTLWNLSKDKHDIDVKWADRYANSITPGFWTFTSPMWIAVAGILGFETVGAMSAFAATYPGVFSSLIGSTMAGETLNEIVKVGSEGRFSSWGDMMNHYVGHGEKSSDVEKFLWELTNLGYMADPLSQTVLPIKQFGSYAFDQTLNALRGPLTNKALNYANKYGLGEATKAGIYNANRAFNALGYTIENPKVVKNAALLHLKFGLLDAAWTVKNSMRPKRFRANMSIDWLNPNLEAYKPSDRAAALKYADMVKNLNEYLLNHSSGPKGHILYTKTMQPYEEFEGEIVPARIKVSADLDYWSNPTYLFEDPDIAKASLVTNGPFIPIDEEEVLYSHAADAIGDPFTDRTFLRILTGGMSDLPVRSKEMGPAATEVNDLLGDLGHVTGSNVTYTNPYATHEPNDIDIITTEDNLNKVIAQLLGTIVTPGTDHVKVHTPNYGEVDIQIIRRGRRGGSKGKIALQIYSKLNPQEYYNNVIKSGNYTVPIPPEELLRIHKDNAVKFSTIDLLISGSPKHAARNINILRCPDQSIVKEETNRLENVYRAYLGPEFLSIEDLGVRLDYSNVLNNLEFLNKLGFGNAEQIAKDPVRMEYLIKSLLYQTHTANRTVNGTGLTTTDILKTMHTNGSGSNLGGNNARSKFGGGLEYGEANPFVGMIEFPIKHPEELKTPMDVYKYLTKIVDLSDFVYYNARGERFTNFNHHKLFSETFTKNIFRDSKLDPEVALEAIDLLKPSYILDNTDTNMSSLLTFGVPNRNDNLNIPMYYGWTYDPQVAERLYTLNDNLARLFDINHIYSLLHGFGDLFVGRYARHIPNVRSSIVKSSDSFGNYFPGFELPTTSFISPDVRTFSVRPTTDLAHPMPSIKPVEKARLASARNNKAKQDKADQIRRETYDLIQRLRSLLYRSVNQTRSRAKAAAAIGAGAAGIYGISKIPVSGFVSRQTARDIVNNINYKDTNELRKYLEEGEIYLTDELYKKLNELSKEGTSTNFYLELREYINDYLKQHADD